AGHFCLFPEARLDDGRLNVLNGRLDPIRFLIEDLAILTQTYAFDWSRRRQAQVLEVELAQPATFMLDGELIENVQPVTFQVGQGKLRCCSPAAVLHARSIGG